MKNWKTQLILTHESGTLMSDNINIKKGFFQGDSLSPLLFYISLIPFSLELNSLGYGYKIRTERITHLFYMDLESSGIQHAAMKQKLKKELVRRTQLILKTELNSKNRITAIITLAIPVITYSFNITDWNLSEVKRLDVKIRKMITTHSIHHPKADIHRLYLPRSSRGRGFLLNSSCLIKHRPLVSFNT